MDKGPLVVSYLTWVSSKPACLGKILQAKMDRQPIIAKPSRASINITILHEHLPLVAFSTDDLKMIFIYLFILIT